MGVEQIESLGLGHKQLGGDMPLITEQRNVTSTNT